MARSSRRDRTGTSTPSTSRTATTGAATTPALHPSFSDDEILPAVNAFCYGQVKSAYGSGQFKKDLDQQALPPSDERIILS